MRQAAQYFAQTRRARQEWRTLDDLTPQLAEIDLRCAAGDYDEAAGVLSEIDFDYLLLWGYDALLVMLHERLLDQLDDPWRRSYSLNILGLAYVAALGEVGGDRALRAGAGDQSGDRRPPRRGRFWATWAMRMRTWAKSGDSSAGRREIGDRSGEGTGLGNLGSAYSSLGDVRRAIEHYEQALVISREIGDRRGEGAGWATWAWRMRTLGEVGRAIEQYEQALAIDREIGDRRGEGAHLGNLGVAYAALGSVRRAIEHYEQALVISREIGDRYNELLTITYGGVCQPGRG